jgi:hypothetical protein
MTEDAVELAQALKERIDEATEHMKRNWSERALAKSGMDRVLQGEAVEVSNDQYEIEDHGL